MSVKFIFLILSRDYVFLTHSHIMLFFYDKFTNQNYISHIVFDFSYFWRRKKLINFQLWNKLLLYECLSIFLFFSSLIIILYNFHTVFTDPYVRTYSPVSGLLLTQCSKLSSAVPRQVNHRLPRHGNQLTVPAITALQLILHTCRPEITWA